MTATLAIHPSAAPERQRTSAHQPRTPARCAPVGSVIGLCDEHEAVCFLRGDLRDRHVKLTWMLSEDGLVFGDMGQALTRERAQAIVAQVGRYAGRLAPALAARVDELIARL